MDNELQDIYQFLRQTVSLRKLPDHLIRRLVDAIRIGYVRKGKQVPSHTQHVIIVRKGLIAHYDINGHLNEKYAEQDCFNLLNRDVSDSSLLAEEDCLLYQIEHQYIEQLIANSPDLKPLLRQDFQQRVNETISEIDQQAILSSTLSNRLVSDCYHAGLHSVEVGTTIKESARLMSARDISCMVVLEQQKLAGIVTDKDLRNRVLALGLDLDTAIEAIMSTNIQTININATAFDALMRMTSQHIHHLPVTDNGQLVGMVTITDLMIQEANNAVNLSRLIHKADTVDELVAICELLPKLQIRLTRLGTRASQVAKSISSLTRSLTHRLAVLAEQHLGTAPVAFAWVGLGSQARQEQLIHTDQDNALIISDNITDADADWFESFARFINDGLNACGFEYCPGDVMASNPKWRQPQKVWHQYFHDWVTNPNPKALMHTSIFFDMDCLYGDASLVNEVRYKMLEVCRGNTIFIAHLTQNALSHRPPLGLIRDFVLISEGEHKSTLDIKHNGLAPIVDLARIYALSDGIPAVNTIERLHHALDTPSISSSAAHSLIDAMELLMQIRLEHQTRQLSTGNDPDNFLSPAELSSLERQHLKDAFKVIKLLQDSRQSLL